MIYTLEKRHTLGGGQSEKYCRTKGIQPTKE